MCYNDSTYGKPNLALTNYWLQQAAQQDHTESQYNLGICYELGHGIEKDLQKAAEYYQKAAEKGYAPAQYNLGVCYYNGNGVEKNIENAKKWFELAAPQGHQKAIEALEIINR